MKRHLQPARKAAVLVAALVCLLIALSVATTMVAETIARRVQLQIELTARQTELLVQAGQGRAVASLAASSDYSGERWAPEVRGDKSALVTITTEPANDGARRVTVVATYPDGDPKAVRRSRVFFVTNTSLTPEE